ncbi:MAG: PIG-L family deacetylase [candidate division Zixibacteria bacterium]|nr:PIG-L family deacetylase [candidate division Zixibacteria bacterium]
MSHSTVLVLAAHPDDEVLGCGASMARHVREGDSVHVVILAEGVTSRDKKRDRDLRDEDLSALSEAAKRANALLGVESLSMGNLPDNRLDTVPLLDIVKLVEGYFDTVKPDIVYTHHAGDLNIDHRCIHQAVVTACRPIPGKKPVDTLLFFEVPSSTEWQPPGSAEPFTPDWFTDITDSIDVKLEALKEYSSEMRPWPHARSLEAVEHLARWRGANVGVSAAEAFKLGRKLLLLNRGGS